MADGAHDDIDRRLRESFEPTPEAVGRVRDGALAAPRQRRRAWKPALAVAFVAGLVAAAVFWPHQPAPPVEPTLAAFSGSLSDGLLIVALPDGSTAITGGEVRMDRPPSGYGIVVVEGELP